MSAVLKVVILAVAWIIYFLIGMSGGSSSSGGTGTIPSPTPATEPTQTEALPEANDDTYAEDPVVNRFITEFNAADDEDIFDISKGNIRTKYFGRIRNNGIELINANDAGAGAFSVSISGGKEESDTDALFVTFKEIVKILEPSLSDNTISSEIEELRSGNVVTEKYQFGSTMLVTYIRSETKSRIDILAYEYKETPSAMTAVSTEPIEMDSLQALFASLSNTMTREEIDKYISENGLVKYAFTHDSGYYIGYESSAVRQRGSDRIGAAVDVNFVTNGDPDIIGTVNSAEYAIHTEASTHYALKFEDGVFYYEGEACASGEEAMQRFLAANR